GCAYPVPSAVHHVPCAYLRLVYYKIVRRGRTYAKVVDRVEEHAPPFWIEDDEGARIALDPRAVRIDGATEATDSDEMVFESRLRVGETVAVIGVVAADAPGRGSYRSPSDGRGEVRFQGVPLVTWRTEPEFVPSPRLSASGAVLAAIGLGFAVFRL